MQDQRPIRHAIRAPVLPSLETQHKVSAALINDRSEEVLLRRPGLNAAPHCSKPGQVRPNACQILSIMGQRRSTSVQILSKSHEVGPMCWKSDRTRPSRRLPGQTKFGRSGRIWSESAQTVIGRCRYISPTTFAQIRSCRAKSGQSWPTERQLGQIHLNSSYI